jgi:BlaI family penicillinase repressor
MRYGDIMMESDLPSMSPGELDVMKILWSGRRLSAREVHEQASESLDWSYSSTRTVLERLVKKGLVEKQPFHGLHLYAARISRAAGLARWVRDFADRVLDGPTAPVLSMMAESGTLSREELRELRSLLDDEAQS